MGSLSPGDVAGGCKLLRNRYESRDREWATYTCVLGFHVYGEQGHRAAEPCGSVGEQGAARLGLGMLDMCMGWTSRNWQIQPKRPPWRALGTGKDCLERGGWVAGLPALGREMVQLWTGGGGGEVGLRPAAVIGVWPDGSDGTDINSLCRSHNERVVAVADDFCKVHLFQYPCARAKVRPPGASGAGRAAGVLRPL